MQSTIFRVSVDRKKSFNKIGQKKDQLKEEVKESAEKGKQKVKKWYSDLKRKYQ